MHVNLPPMGWNSWNTFGSEINEKVVMESADVLAESGLRDAGYTYLVINNSKEVTTLELPKDATVYALTGNGKLRSRTMLLNGQALVLGENDELPALDGAAVPAGTLEVQPGGCTFVVL